MSTEGILLKGQSYLAWEASKDPSDVVDFSMDWSGDLDADTDEIASSTWTVEAGSGLTIDSDSNTTKIASVWFSLGNVGIWEVVNKITTTGNRTYERTRMLVVEEL